MAIHLQPRDVRILAELGEYGFLNSTALHARHWPAGSTSRACQQRLMLLSQDGYIKRVQLVVTHQATPKSRAIVGGSIPSAFALTPAGAELLLELAGVQAKRVSKSEPAAATLLHRLEMVEARLTLDDACRHHGLALPEWIYEYDSLPGIKMNLADPPEDRFILYERFQIGEHSPYCRPDASCRLAIPHSGGNGADTLIAYWELDRGSNSLTVEREKTYGYDALFGTERYRNHWPGDLPGGLALRVFYVCPSQERIDNLIHEVRSCSISRFYRFAVRAELSVETALTSPIWRGVDGKPYAIKKSSATTP